VTTDTYLCDLHGYWHCAEHDPPVACQGWYAHCEAKANECVVCIEEQAADEALAARRDR
jgi:hypothetical protein